MSEQPPVRGPAGWFARAVVRLRWWVIGFWVVATLGSLLFLPSFSSGDSNGGLKGILSSDTPAVKAEKRSYELFGFPLIARTVVVQRAPGGMSPYAQARTVVRAAGVDAGKGDEVWPVLGALPIINTPGLFPGAREANTTSLTYLLFGPETSIGSRTRAAHRYARDYFEPRDHVVGITGSAPARSEQGHIIGDALPHVELATLLAIVLIVGIAFRSVMAPLLTVVTAGVAYVATLRFSGAITRLFDLPSPDELKPVVVALLLGVVTDYVVFFCSSLRDVDPELRGSREATIRAIARTGPIVLIAGFAVAAGTATLLVAKSPFFRALGPALSFTVLVGVVVAVTLVPALLAVLGELVFWPSGLRGLRRIASQRVDRWSVRAGPGPRAAPEGLPWPRAVVRRLVRRRAIAGGVVATCVAGMLLAASPLLGLDLGVSFVSALPRDAPVRAAAIAAQKGFSPGILSPTVVLLEGKNLGRQHAALAELGDRLSAQPGVAGVLGPESQPVPVQGGLLVNRDGNAARYLVVLDQEPLGASAVHTVDRLTAELPYMVGQSGLGRAHVGVAGDSATASFLVHQTEHDLLRIAIAAMLANLLMLLLFLRAPVTALVLLSTTLLSLSATLGLTTALFNWLEPGQGLTFYVPFAVAVLLLAFGSDYNIFTVGHVWEAMRLRSLPEALERAYPRAIRAVTAAGVALAASFGLLVLVPLLPFRQLAFGVGLGIALDIFVVRALLVPSLLSLLEPAATWPPGLQRRRDRDHSAAGTHADGGAASSTQPAPALVAQVPAAGAASPTGAAATSSHAYRSPPRAQPPAAYLDQQQVIRSVLDAVGGQSVTDVRRELRRSLVRAGLPLPPDAWLDTVAGKISRRQLYVVATWTAEDDQRGAATHAGTQTDDG